MEAGNTDFGDEKLDDDFSFDESEKEQKNEELNGTLDQITINGENNENSNIIDQRIQPISEQIHLNEPEIINDVSELDSIVQNDFLKEKDIIAMEEDKNEFFEGGNNQYGEGDEISYIESIKLPIEIITNEENSFVIGAIENPKKEENETVSNTCDIQLSDNSPSLNCYFDNDITNDSKSEKNKTTSDGDNDHSNGNFLPPDNLMDANNISGERIEENGAKSDTSQDEFMDLSLHPENSLDIKGDEKTMNEAKPKVIDKQITKNLEQQGKCSIVNNIENTNDSEDLNGKYLINNNNQNCSKHSDDSHINENMGFDYNIEKHSNNCEDFDRMHTIEDETGGLGQSIENSIDNNNLKQVNEYDSLKNDNKDNDNIRKNINQDHLEGRKKTTKSALDKILESFSKPSPFAWKTNDANKTPKKINGMKRNIPISSIKRQILVNKTISPQKISPSSSQEKRKSVKTGTDRKDVIYKSLLKSENNKIEKCEDTFSVYFPSYTVDSVDAQKPASNPIISDSGSPMTFLTSVSDSKTYQTKEMKLVKKQPPKSTRIKKFEGKHLTPAMMSFLGAPPIPVTKRIDLTKYEGRDASFDPSTYISKVPEKILELVCFPEQHLVYHAICGSLLPDIPNNVVSQVNVELKKILNTCIKNGLITESMYIEQIIANLKDVHSKKVKEKNTNELKNRLGNASSQLDEVYSSFEKKEKKIDSSEMMAQSKLEQDFLMDSMLLENEWNSDAIQSKFNKPSSKLIELRNLAKANLQAHRFEDAISITSQIAALEQIEAQEAGRRMTDSYNQNIQKLQQKYQTIKTSLSEKFNTKRQKLQVERQQIEYNLHQRMKNLNTQIVEIEKGKEQNERKEIRESVLSSILEKTNQKITILKCPPIVLDGKLKLPPLSQFQRPNSKSSLSEKSIISPQYLQ